MKNKKDTAIEWLAVVFMGSVLGLVVAMAVAVVVRAVNIFGWGIAA